MFGYVQPLKPELKMKEYEAFKGYYCGLCKAIKEEYTNTARFMLNYDCAVLSLLLSSMSDEVPVVGTERCIINPLKKRTVIRTRESGYAAGVNILLGYSKIKDNAQDEKKITGTILSGVYKSVSKLASKDYSSLAEEIAGRMRSLRELEKKKCPNVDEVSEQSALMLAAVFSMAPYGFLGDSERKALWHLGFNLGRWIYIADALSDIVKDDKTGSYNVFLQGKYEDVKSLKEKVIGEVEFNLKVSLSESCKAYELLDIKRDKPLIDNIMYLGLAKKTEDILSDKSAN